VIFFIEKKGFMIFLKIVKITTPGNIVPYSIKVGCMYWYKELVLGFSLLFEMFIILVLRNSLFDKLQILLLDIFQHICKVKEL